MSREASRGPIRKKKEGQKMKRINLMRCLRAILIVCMMVFSTASAFGFDDGDFSYSYNLSTKEGTLTSYKGSSSHVTIPSSFSIPETYRDSDGETHTRYYTINVTAIGSSVFEKNTTIRSVAFSSNLKSIGWRAFSGCTNLDGDFFNREYEEHRRWSVLQLLQNPVWRPCSR